MGKKSGKAVKAVLPAVPDKADDADLADPGKMAEIIKEQIEKQKGKYGSTKAKPFKPPKEDAETTEDSTEEQKEEEEKSWIEIKMVDQEDQPLAGEKYKITLPDDTEITGTLDGDGFARHDGIPKGNCKVTFPDLDKEAWKDK